jgi:hypothetical protein
VPACGAGAHLACVSTAYHAHPGLHLVFALRSWQLESLLLTHQLCGCSASGVCVLKDAQGPCTTCRPSVMEGVMAW